MLVLCIVAALANISFRNCQDELLSQQQILRGCVFFLLLLFLLGFSKLNIQLEIECVKVLN